MTQAVRVPLIAVGALMALAVIATAHALAEAAARRADMAAVAAQANALHASPLLAAAAHGHGHNVIDDVLRDPLGRGTSTESATDAPELPVALERRTYRVQHGDTWNTIARRFATTRTQLRAWNRDLDVRFKAGVELSVWVAPDFEPLPLHTLGLDRDATGLTLVPIPDGAISRGQTSRGRLIHGAQLPRNDLLYLVRRPEFAYGSSHTLSNLQLALAKFRQHSPYRGPLVVSDMSQRRGRRFGSHKSHRSGRDADIWLPLREDLVSDQATLAALPRIRYMYLAAERSSQIDWPATLELVKALVKTGEVQYIFLSRSRQRHLYRAARADGLTREQLADLMQYPRRGKHGIVRHVRSHHKHIHVRFRCGPDEQHCH